MDDRDLLRAQAALGDGEGADHVVAHNAAGIPQHVRFAALQPKSREHVDSTVHARDDRQPPGWTCLEPVRILARARPLGGEELVDDPHAREP